MLYTKFKAARATADQGLKRRNRYYLFTTHDAANQSQTLKHVHPNIHKITKQEAQLTKKLQRCSEGRKQETGNPEPYDTIRYEMLF